MTKYAPTQRHPNDKLIYLSEDSQKLYYVDPPPTGGVKPNTGKYMKVQEILRVDSASGNELGFQKFKNVRFGKETFGIVVTGERILELDSVRMEDKELFMSSLNILLQNKK